MDLPTYRRDLKRDEAAWAEHRQILRAWNATVQTSAWEAAPQDLYDFLLSYQSAGEVIDSPAYDGSPEAVQ